MVWSLGPSRRTVVGMLTGAGMSAVISFHSACRFFSQDQWEVDRLGLAVARLVVDRLLPAGAPITVAVDDTLFRRWGKKVHHAFWTHDGAAQGPAKLGRGNRRVVAGIVVQLSFTSHPTCLPVLFRLWAGKHTTSPVQLAGQMISLLTDTFPDRVIHVVGDAAYHGTPLSVADATMTTRLPVNAALYRPTPPRTDRRGRPRKKGHRPGTPTDLAATERWHTVRVDRYGHTDTIQAATLACLWYGAFADTPGRLVLVRDPGSTTGYDLALFTTDTSATAGQIVARYAQRWSIEVANATGKQVLGVGQARNRVAHPVERTVPFGFLVQTLVTCWYATIGYHRDDLAGRNAAEPWYTNTEPAFEDMLAKLRRTLTEFVKMFELAIKPWRPCSWSLAWSVRWPWLLRGASG
ncbi:IS701 family transposase [Leekyejoonella antrihumi]|uniref:Transposase n=1 Tax=Leekyejoonella antrihumi TaxID=1660198 RepID=A0A563DRE1_9MICO|nr:transposase [Leekyejoonella antrihumi]TWP32848.1 transposase [Leekyejoonella antrihumi]